jgi:hypothetical protein
MAFGNGPRIVTDGLVMSLDAADRNSYVSGSTTWFDLSGNNNNGSLINGPIFNSGSGGSVFFDGADDLIYTPISINTANDFTVEVVAKCNTMDNNGANRQTIWSFNNGTTNGYQLLDLEVWGDQAYSFNGDGTNFIPGPVNISLSIQANNIHFYTVSCISNILYWYIDSVFKTSYTKTYSGTSVFYKLATRGSGATGTGQQWNGLIYSAKIYNKGLSSQEILQNYNAQKSRFGL